MPRIEETRCQSCKLLPYRHASNGSYVSGRRRGGIKRYVTKVGKPMETITVCREYNPNMRGKRIFTSLWKDLWNQ